MIDTQSFDQGLYEDVMSDKMDHALGVPSLATEYSDGYDSGYHHAALTAARLSAERTGAVSDEELFKAFAVAHDATLYDGPEVSDPEFHAVMDGIRAVRAALQAAIAAAKENES